MLTLVVGDSRHRADGQRRIGRGADLRRVETFLKSIRTVGGTLLISGEPGVGKSVLLAAVAPGPPMPARPCYTRQECSSGPRPVSAVSNDFCSL